MNERAAELGRLETSMAESRSLDLKGKTESTTVYVLRPRSDRRNEGTLV